MNAWHAASKSRTVLLVVIGVLLVPTAALAARLVSTWQSGSPVVRKLEPLAQVVRVALSEDDRTVYGGYAFSTPLPAPTPNLSGAYVTEMVVAATVTIPDSVVQGLEAAASSFQYNSDYCILGVFWADYDEINSDYATYVQLYAFYLNRETDFAVLAGPHTSTQLASVGPDLGSHFPELELGIRLSCSVDGGAPAVDFGTTPIEVRISSVRILAL